MRATPRWLVPTLEIVGAVALIVAFAKYGEHRRWNGAVGAPLATRVWPFHLENWPWTNEEVWTPRIYSSLATSLVALAATWHWLRARRRVLALLVLLVAAHGFHVAVNVQRYGVPDSLHRTFERGIEYWQDVRLVDRDFLRRYPDLTGLSLHGETHPPGYALFLYGLRRLGVVSMDTAALLTSLFTPLTALFLYGFARRRFGEEVATFAVPLFLFACSVSAFTLSLMDMVNMGCAAMSLYGLALVLDRRPAGGVLLGLGYALASLCTLTSLVLGLAYALVLLGELRARGRAAIPVAGLAIAIASFVTFYGVLGLLGYRPFAVAESLFRNFSASVNRKRNYWRGLFGNPVAFPGALGFPLLGLTAHALGTSLVAIRRGLRERRWPAPDPMRTWLAAALAPFYLCLLLGKPRAEVEHIFMFLVPPLVLALAAAALRWYARARSWVLVVSALAIAQSILIEVYLDTSW